MRYRPPPVCPSAAGVPPGTGGVRPCAGALARVGSRVANGRRARGGKRTGPHGSLFAALTRHGRPTVVPPDEVGPPQSHRSVDPPEPHRSPTAVAGTPPAAALCRLAPGEKRGWPCGSLAMRLGLARVRAARGTGAACLGTARGARARRHARPTGSSGARCVPRSHQVDRCTQRVVCGSTPLA